MKNRGFLDDKIKAEDAKTARHQQIKDKMDSMLKEHTFIDSVAMVKEKLSEESSMSWKSWEIRHVMRHDMGMRYKKIKPVSIHANSPKNLVLRQQFTLELIKQLHAGKTIINVDETWLGMADFRRMKWCPHKDTNSVPVMQLQPRISMIVALDTSGRVPQPAAEQQQRLDHGPLPAGPGEEAEGGARGLAEGHHHAVGQCALSLGQAHAESPGAAEDPHAIYWTPLI